MPKEKTMRTGRRAASKEALKQMHNIFLGEKRKVTEPPTRDDVQVLSDDDDVVEVSVQPPVKKYKVSNKKSTTGSSLDVIVLKSLPCAETLEMDFAVEELSAAQVRQRDQLRKEEALIQEKLDALVKDKSAQVVYTGVCTTALEVSEHIKSIMANVQAPIVLQPSAASTQSVPSYQLVMDPRSGVIVGAVTATNASQPAAPTPPLVYAAKPPPKAPVVKRRGAILRQVPSSSISPLHKAALQQSKNMKKIVQTTKALPPPPVLKRNVVAAAMTPVQPLPPVVPRGRPLSAISRTRLDLNAPHVANELTATGGVGKAIAAPASTKEDDTRALSDSREVSFNKLQGRTYPSLVVIARPHLRVKDLTSDRTKLDLTVKGVLLHQATKFTEWLIQQGLVRSEQKCSNHYSRMLKLGMYSDASKFPYSGGYVWISECCPNRFVSVFSGSLFEGSAHPPIAILKLLYHWCCQTIVQNVTQWVKVENLFVKNVYTWLRAVCTVAIQTHFKMIGGYGSKVQIGVISLGTTSQDGNKREVKVEVLGILETSTRQIRLRAIEPLPDGERNYKKRFNKILEPVQKWVHPGSHIITDLTVDKQTLNQMGFTYVTQSTTNDYNKSNRTIMEYLRRIVPRMFQSALSLLSRAIIQQFLDELVWREWYGYTVNTCFENIIKHLSEQTRSETSQSLIARLNKVSAEPFLNWNINNALPVLAPAPPAPLPTIGAPEVPTKQYRRVRKPVATASPQQTDTNEQMVPLENYYYGTITPQIPKMKVHLYIKCPFCNGTFATNIQLMNHLFKHAHNLSAEAQLCRYCLTIVPDGQELLKHITTSHPDETKFNNVFVCLICEDQFRNPFILGKHMSKGHAPAELPYNCGTCTFRCSNHKQAIDHFYDQHDNGTTIQCPFCLKSTTVHTNGRNITQNINFFIQHLQKHQKKNLAKKCNRCSLWFVQKEFLKYHQSKMHISMRGKHGLVPMSAPRSLVMVPKSNTDKGPVDDNVINFNTLRVLVKKNLDCKECGTSLLAAKHFTSFKNCKSTNCKYSTSCAIAMQKHEAKCKATTVIPDQNLPFRMFCICGYSDDLGNSMAKHLVVCERKSAYPSMVMARKAAVQPSIMNVLGLVRKPEEPLAKADNVFKPIILKAQKKPPAPPIETMTIESEDETTDETIIKEETNEIDTEEIPLPVNVNDIKTDKDTEITKENTEVGQVRVPENDNAASIETTEAPKNIGEVRSENADQVDDNEKEDDVDLTTNKEVVESNEENEAAPIETVEGSSKPVEEEPIETAAVEESSKVAEEDAIETAAVEESSRVVDEAPIETPTIDESKVSEEDEHETAAVEESSKVVEEETAAIEERSKVVEEETAVMEERSKTIEEDKIETAAVEECSKTVEEEKIETAAVEDNSQTVEEELSNAIENVLNDENSAGKVSEDDSLVSALVENIFSKEDTGNKIDNDAGMDIDLAPIENILNDETSKVQDEEEEGKQSVTDVVEPLATRMEVESLEESAEKMDVD